MAATGAREAERARVASVRGMLLEGHERLIEQLAGDGVTDGPTAAVAVLRAERSRMAVAAQIDRELADAADRFAETVRAEGIARRAQRFVDQMFVNGIALPVEDVIALLAAEGMLQ
jgi:hypothetical protein